MMASMTAREYREWEAYERAVGPIDSEFDRELLAQLHELIQINNQLTGASLTKRGKKNPAGKFRKPIRPDRWYDPNFDPDDEPEEELDDDDEVVEDEFPDELYEDDVIEKKDPDKYDPAKDPFVGWENQK